MKRKILFLVPLIGLVTFGFFFSGSGDTSVTRRQGNLPIIINRTQGFEAVTIERSPQQLYVRFKNHYGKKVTAFQVSLGSDYNVTEEMIFSELDEVGLRSQEIIEKTYPLPSSLQKQPSFELIIRAVMLDDGSGDGEIVAVKGIKAVRLGQEIQIRRALKNVESFLNKGQHDIGRLKADIARDLSASEVTEGEATTRIQRDLDQRVSAKLQQGLDNGRQNTLRRIAEMESLNDPNKGLIKMKDTFQKMLNRL